MVLSLMSGRARVMKALLGYLRIAPTRTPMVARTRYSKGDHFLLLLSCLSMKRLRPSIFIILAAILCAGGDERDRGRGCGFDLLCVSCGEREKEKKNISAKVASRVERTRGEKKDKDRFSASLSFIHSFLYEKQRKRVTYFGSLEQQRNDVLFSQRSPAMRCGVDNKQTRINKVYNFRLAHPTFSKLDRRQVSIKPTHISATRSPFWAGIYIAAPHCCCCY